MLTAVFAVIIAATAGIKTFEGRRPIPYTDAGGTPTVCDGITGADVIPGKTYTDSECDALLIARLQAISNDIAQCVKVDLDQGEWRAYLDLSYNIGTTAFCKSSMVKLLNAGDHAKACEQISRWTFVEGKDCRLTGPRCPGIVKRRDYERNLCESGLGQ